MFEAAVVGVSIDRSQHLVLVVDDNPVTRYATARVLRAAGFRTVEAENGNDALRLARAGVSAVVLDVNLPDIDGFQVCQLLRADGMTALLPVIHLSATYVDDQHKVQGLNAGADAYITHPAEPPILIATVQALVRARMAEMQSRRSEVKFRAIYTQAESGIALVDAEGRFSDANPAMLKMLGRTAEEVLGRPVSDFAPADWLAFVRGKTTGVQKDDAFWHEYFPLLHASGAPVHLEWSMSAYLEPELRVCVATNVSERMQLEEERQRLLEREQAARLAAERNSQAKDDFIAVLSHELRNPLNAMMMALHMLTAKNAQPELQKSVDIIQRNAKAQARIISDILDVSRINSGKLTLSKELALPGALITASVEGMGATIAQKQLTMDLQLEADDRPMWIDPIRFQQVFWNLLSNAVKFSPTGGNIRVRVQRDTAKLSLTVSDNGIGIEPLFMASIFDKFSQDYPVQRSSQGGLGLGMSIVKHLVELHSGTVAVHSAGKDQGTTVQVELPVLEPDNADSASSAVELAPSDHGGILQGLRILVVEDDIQALEMLALILRERGAVVDIAQDYDNAVRIFTDHPADAIVSDIGLPGKDGHALIRALRGASPPASQRPIAIALTAFGRPEDHAMALASGFDVHMSKPLRPLHLIATIERLRQRI